MKKILLVILFSITLWSCKKTEEKINKISFNSIVSKSDQLTIKLYDTTDTQKKSRGIELLKPKEILNITNKQDIEDFKNIFDNSNITEYCCCPTSIYTISLLKNKKEFDIFYVDTIEFKDEIRIYEKSFQYSFLIQKQKWKDFLNKK
jgi:hypothetical protein